MNHNNENLTVYELVLNRLPFLKDTENNKKLISTYTLEAMYELEPCFRVGIEFPEHIGDEQYYGVIQKSIIADIVAIYILMFQILANLGGGSVNNEDIVGAGGKFLKKAEAGSVNVEWEQYDINKGSGLFLSGEKLIAMYKKSAMRKGHSIGCIIDICEDCTIAIELLTVYDLPTFKVVTSGCGCGCAGETLPVERGGRR